ncbi:MAG: hypothetical protein HY517_04235 [Candidatus Aenigmarchaeota archaeon]|nr:hypothetical protein [Candidatus Aenigmarchaeota archaeon]
MKNSKGLELPINMIVVIAIAVLVLVVVAAFFAGRIGGGGDEIALTAAFNTGCNNLRSVHNCIVGDIPTIRVPGYAPSGEALDPTGYPFDRICQRKGFSNVDCARACGCSVSGGTTSSGGNPAPSLGPAF